MMSITGRILLVCALLALGSIALFAQDVAVPAPAAPSPAAPSPGILEGLSPEAAMDLANAWGMNSDENKVNIWVNGRELHFEFPDGTKTVIPLPADRMVVSFAPYIMKTHPCREHFPSSCRGELANTPVEVKAVAADGTVLLSEKTTTLPDGFVDLWLPRNREIDVTLTARGLTATQRIGTFDKDKTCITEAKLHY